MKQKLLISLVTLGSLVTLSSLISGEEKSEITKERKVEFSYSNKDIDNEMLQIKHHQTNEDNYKYIVKLEKQRKMIAERKAESVREKASSELGTFNVSWYTPKCTGCSGITATGIDVRNTKTYQGYQIAASDWNVIPPYSIIEVEGYGKFIVLDKGGAIKGNKLDLLVMTKQEAYSNGRKNLKVKLIRKGK